MQPGQQPPRPAGGARPPATGARGLRTVGQAELLAHAPAGGNHLPDSVAALGHPLIAGVRGAGLLRAIVLSANVSVVVADRALAAGFIVNAPTPDALRLTPPLVITTGHIDTFVAELPTLLEGLEPSS